MNQAIAVPPNGNANDPAGLDAAADFIKVSTGFAAGSLVFSVGLINSALSLSICARVSLLVAWIALFFAMVTGVIAHSRIPIKKSAKDYSLEDPFLTTPTRLHQGVFSLGVISLGITLFLTLFGEPPANTQGAATAIKALALAERCVPKDIPIKKVSLIESIKGIDTTHASLATWHVQFETIPKNRDAGTSSRKVALMPSQAASLATYVDVFVDAHSGVATSLGSGLCPHAAKIPNGSR